MVYRNPLLPNFKDAYSLNNTSNHMLQLSFQKNKNIQDFLSVIELKFGIKCKTNASFINVCINF